MKNIFLRLFQFKGFISIIYYIALLALLWYLIIPHTSFFFFNSFFNPFFDRLNKEDVTLITGEEFRLYTYKLNQRVSYSSTDIKVAGVNFLGTVTAYRPGTTIIKVKYNDKVLKCRVRVVAINKRKLVLRVGDSSYLDIKGAWVGVKWYSAKSTIASINRFGKVTAKAKGTVTIYGKVRGKTMSCKVIVK